MLLGIVLLYVGAVLAINGIWLWGQAKAAKGAAQEEFAGREGVVTAEAAAGGAGAATATTAAPGVAMRVKPDLIQGREVTMINLFTGFIGAVCAVTLLVQGNADGDLGFVRGAGFILLFAFTYLWVAANQFLNADGHAFGWYCLFVAVTAGAAGAYQFIDTPGTVANVWLGVDWFAWAFLWFLFWVLLSLERPIGRFTGSVAFIEGVGTSWALGFAILIGRVAF